MVPGVFRYGRQPSLPPVCVDRSLDQGVAGCHDRAWGRWEVPLAVPHPVTEVACNHNDRNGNENDGGPVAAGGRNQAWGALRKAEGVTP